MKRRSRNELARDAARAIPAGSFINLGIGLPVMMLDHIRPEDEIIVHSENGVLGMRALASDEPPDVDLTNAAKQPVGLLPCGSYFDITVSFAMMRGGHLDYCVLGAFQVSASGDLANWSLQRPGVAPAVGGAMDLAVGAKRVYVLMEHTTHDGQPRLLANCTLPLTGRAVVTRVYTDLATIEITHGGFSVIEMVPGLSREQLQALTGAPLQFNLRQA